MMTGRYPATAASELSTPKAPPAGSGFAFGTALTEGAPLFCSFILLSPFLSKREKGFVCFSYSVQNDLFRKRNFMRGGF